MDDRRMIIGLGNPGTEYEDTYHNVGMLALAALADAFCPPGETVNWQTHQKAFRYAKIAGIAFVEPLVFMNESGRAASSALKKFGITPAAMVVVHDDSDLPLGEFKISRAQGAAGHHGVESIIATIGTNDFERIRIGIRPTGEQKREKAGSFVLKKITSANRTILEKTFSAIAEKLNDSRIR